MKISPDFLDFMRTRDAIAADNDLPIKEGLILREIVAAYINKEIFTVNQVLALNNIGSMATNHMMLKKLLQKKLVISSPNLTDKRIKHLLPSPIALNLFSRLSNEFVRCANKKSKLFTVPISRK